ncbi:hypothetical protein H1Q63_26625 [Desmonostoc muscorum CCALA 125]|nr:hypothetical protein [Desmonostoc muscorum CCALA 125]
MQTLRVNQPTPLQQEMNRLVSRLFGIALLLCVAIVVIYGLTRGDWWRTGFSGVRVVCSLFASIV